MINRSLETNLNVITEFAIQEQQNNDRFIEYLKNLNSSELDTEVLELEKEITPQIDCKTCGNCCKSLMINVDEDEAKKASIFLNKTRDEFDDLYISKSESGKMVINAIPCHFLDENKCTIYENRFSSCKEFPSLHLPFVQRRLFTIFMHYQRCPIIFNVMEELKKSVRFI